MKKVYDLAVKVGSYQKDGETKNRYENVGAIMEGDKGQFMFLKRSFNPAGIDADGKESIIISMFAPKEKTGNAQNDSSPSWEDATPF
jgi:hypothetical protein